MDLTKIGVVFLGFLMFGMTEVCAQDTPLPVRDTLPADTGTGLKEIAHDSIPAKKRRQKEQDGIKRGWTFGALPNIAYDTDLGLKLGALANIFYYGDGSTYPQYLHSIYAEASYTFKRSGIFRVYYDSRYLIPETRLTIDVSYLPDAMCDFSGFNGYKAVYNADWINSKLSPEEGYKTRAFYKYKRDLLRITADFQRKIKGKFNWAAGVGVLAYFAGRVNVDFLNKGKKTENKLPEMPTLYDHYVKWGIISENEKDGGVHPYIRGGATFDTRDKQTNPNKGMLLEAFLTYYAAFGKQKAYNHLNLNLSFRHYVPLYKEYISFAYRVGYQGTIAGESPFYIKNYFSMLFIQRAMYEALGGGNSLRGVIRNRVTGDGFIYANTEFRFKIVKFKIKRQSFYIGLNPLFDVGYIVQPVKSDIDQAVAIASVDPDCPDFRKEDYFTNKDNIHASAGIGLKIAMNENFVVSLDWAHTLNKQDGKMSFYIQMGYMF